MTEYARRPASSQDVRANWRRTSWLSRYIVIKIKYLLLRCAHGLSCAQLFATPWTVAHQIPLSMEFSRPEHWSGLPFPTPGDLPDPRIEHTSFASPSLAARFFSTTWEANVSETHCNTTVCIVEETTASSVPASASVHSQGSAPICWNSTVQRKRPWRRSLEGGLLAGAISGRPRR